MAYKASRVIVTPAQLGNSYKPWCRRAELVLMVEWSILRNVIWWARHTAASSQPNQTGQLLMDVGPSQLRVSWRRTQAHPRQVYCAFRLCLPLTVEATKKGRHLPPDSVGSTAPSIINLYSTGYALPNCTGLFMKPMSCPTPSRQSQVENRLAQYRPVAAGPSLQAHHSIWSATPLMGRRNP